MIQERYRSDSVTGTNAGVAIKATPGFLHAIQVGTPTATSVVTIYDNASAASGTVLFMGTMTSGNPFSVLLNKRCDNGIFVVVANAGCDLGLSFS